MRIWKSLEICENFITSLLNGWSLVYLPALVEQSLLPERAKKVTSFHTRCWSTTDAFSFNNYRRRHWRRTWLRCCNASTLRTTLLVYLKLPFPALRSISTRREEIYNSTLTLLLSDASWFSQSLNNKKSCRFFNFFSKKVITNQNFEFDDDRGGGVKVWCSDLFCIAWWMFRGSKTSIFLSFHILSTDFWPRASNLCGPKSR